MADSEPVCLADAVSSIASAVELPPVPAMTGMRPLECWTAIRISSARLERIYGAGLLLLGAALLVIR